ncbi:MAG: SpoIIE family protein phosphatase [Gammaproteobacteria bacterium]|nr:SpoIIE family protein phosphatase [Gammaproteobacteria bacterium]
MSEEPQSRRVLVVDDNRINVKAIAEALKQDYKVMAAANGEQALAAVVSDHCPDVVLLDIMMPDMDGFEVCRRIKADDRTSHIPVIFITSKDDDSDEAQGLEFGAADYITKPIVPAVVRARVRTQMQLRGQLEALESANSTIQAQHDRMEHELQVGKQLQQSLMPDLPEATAFSIAGSMQSAYEVGGDFYDSFYVDRDHLCLCIGDVSGKGVPAALFMNMSRTLVRLEADGCTSTARIVTRVNTRIEEKNDPCMFVTLLLAILDTRTGRLTYTNAGHTPPFIKRADGRVDRIDGRHGPAVGITSTVFTEENIWLGQGDTILIYTDGVTEARSPDRELYGEDRLRETLSRKCAEDADSVLETTAESVATFEDGGQYDDITMLALSFIGSRDSQPTPGVMRCHFPKRRSLNASSATTLATSSLLQTFLPNSV